MSQSTARLQHTTSAAVSVLFTIILDSKEPAASRVRAAHTVLEMSSRAVEMEDLDARLAELERTVTERSRRFS